MDGGRTTPEQGYTINSPCEPDGSGELIKVNSQTFRRTSEGNNAQFRI